MKRKIILTMMLILVAACAFAGPRLFTGVSFNYDVNYLSPSLLSKFDGIDVDENEEPVYNRTDEGVEGNLSALHAIGPKFDLVLFPFGNVPIGIGVNAATMFNIGYVADGDAHGYFSRNADLRQDVGGGIYYQQGFGSWGFFADCSIIYSWYRIATSNEKNDKTPVNYIRFVDWGLSANLGAYLEHNGSYFRVGGNFYYDLGNTETFAFRYGMTVGGGIAFG